MEAVRAAAADEHRPAGKCLRRGYRAYPHHLQLQPADGLAPLTYGSFQSAVTSDTFGQKLCLATVDHPFPGFFISVLLNTPGAPQERITYALELSMRPFDHRFECFIASNGPAGMPYEAAVQFSPTTAGSHIALVELRGSGDVEGWAHALSFRRGQGTPGMTYFNWLNVVAL